MYKRIIITICTILFLGSSFREPLSIINIQKSNITFRSDAPLELIKASSTELRGVIETVKKEFGFSVSIKSFQGFNSTVQKEHFNENYLESDKYPDAIYKGTINEKVDYTKDGTTKITITGKLNMHGVEKEKKLEGTLVVKGGQINIDGKFSIHIADYNIKIPSVVVKNIAEDVDVKVKATLEPYKK